MVLMASKASKMTVIAFLMRLSFLTSELPRKTAEGYRSSPRAAGPTHTLISLVASEMARRSSNRCAHSLYGYFNAVRCSVFGSWDRHRTPEHRTPDSVCGEC